MKQLLCLSVVCKKINEGSGRWGGGLVKSDADVTFHVQRQVVGAREGSLAQLALERPVAGVLAVVARQLVGAGELPAAALPRALVRLLARVRPQVGLEVRRFRVRLGAALVRARVDDHAPLAPSAAPSRPHHPDGGGSGGGSCAAAAAADAGIEGRGVESASRFHRLTGGQLEMRRRRRRQSFVRSVSDGPL